MSLHSTHEGSLSGLEALAELRFRRHHRSFSFRLINFRPHSPSLSWKRSTAVRSGDRRRTTFSVAALQYRVASDQILRSWSQLSQKLSEMASWIRSVSALRSSWYIEVSPPSSADTWQRKRPRVRLARSRPRIPTRNRSGHWRAQVDRPIKNVLQTPLSLLRLAPHIQQNCKSRNARNAMERQTHLELRIRHIRRRSTCTFSAAFGQ